MKFYYKSTKNDFDAVLDVSEGKYILKKGTKVSLNVSEHFRSTKTVLKRRLDVGIKDDRILPYDVEFSSSSVAGEFVSGSSCNGPSCWKSEDGITLKDVLED